MSFKDEYAANHKYRFDKTLKVLLNNEPPPKKVLDLGPENPLSRLMMQAGYQVQNTPEKTDLDFNYTMKMIEDSDYDFVTSFEIFEHLVNPFGVLTHIGAKKLIATVPLRLWFSTAYWNENDRFDRHYHEFEDRQFDMLLEKSGWKITYTEKWTANSIGLGIRPILRFFTPRHYLVIAEKKQ